MDLQELLKDESGIVRIKMHDGVLYRMVINEKYTLHFRSFNDSRFFFLYGKIGELSEDKTQAYEFLEANLFCQQTGDAFFSWHRETNSLILMASFDSQVASYEQYKVRLQSFVDYFVFWKERFDQTATTDKQEDVLRIMSQKKRIFFI